MSNIPGIIGYVRPGAYVNTVIRTRTVTSLGGARIPCIVGHGKREEYLIKNAQGGETTFRTKVYPIVANKVSLFIERNRELIPLTEGYPVGDFQVDYSSGDVTLFVGLQSRDNLIINYQGTSDVNDPEIFTSPEKLFAKHGYPSVENTLSLGAYLAFLNGAPSIMALQAKDIDEDPFWSESWAVLEGTGDLYLLVPLPSANYLGIQGAAKAHAIQMSDIMYQRPRKVLTGAPIGVTPEALLNTDTNHYTDWLAIEDLPGTPYGIQGDEQIEIDNGNIQDLQNFGLTYNFGDTTRVQYFYPDKINIPKDTKTYVVSGMYIAAAAAGWYAGTGLVSLPLTNKTLVGFSIPRDRQIAAPVARQLLSIGVSVVEPVAGGGRVIHSLSTTSSTDVLYREASITDIRDQVVVQMKNGLEKAFLGELTDDALPAAMAAKASSILTGFQSIKLIRRYRNVVVEESTNDPTQMDVYFDIQPIFGLNYISITFSIGLLG